MRIVPQHYEILQVGLFPRTSRVLYCIIECPYDPSDTFFDECNPQGWGEIRMKLYEFVKLREVLLRKLEILSEHHKLREMLTPDPL